MNIIDQHGTTHREAMIFQWKKIITQSNDIEIVNQIAWNALTNINQTREDKVVKHNDTLYSYRFE